MKTEQILLALEVSKQGSITKAAQNLFIAQPNASNAIAALESELGYRIFERTYNGVEVTKRGAKFLQYAHSIKRNMEKIYSLRDEGERVHLSVATYAYSFAEKAFVRFCAKYIDTANSLKCNLRRIGTVKEGMEMLDRDATDISIIICRRELYGHFEKEFKSRGLWAEILGYMTLQAVMSEQHPLAGKVELDLKEYAAYPCVSNAGLAGNYAPPEIEKLLGEVKMHIVIEPGEARFELLKNSNNFAICTPYPREDLERYHLISKNIPNANRCLVLLIREENQLDLQIQRYIKLLKEEVAVWMKGIA